MAYGSPIYFPTPNPTVLLKIQYCFVWEGEGASCTNAQRFYHLPMCSDTLANPTWRFPAELPRIHGITLLPYKHVEAYGVYVVVQFYPWFKFSFLLFLGMVMYDNNMIMSLKQKKRRFEPRIKLNHNIYTTLVKFAGQKFRRSWCLHCTAQIFILTA